jgi:membrane fusion protein (multidrug efflux system)
MRSETTTLEPPATPPAPVLPKASTSPLPVPDKPAAAPKRHHLVVVIGSVGGILALAYLVPWIVHSLHTVSTDDAYVNSHVTFVAPRVAGQVARVLVDDNNRVRRGDTLVQLDPEPFRVQVAIRQAALNTAGANFAVAEANVHSLLAQARSDRFKLILAIEDVDNQVALIRQRVAAWEQSKATLVLGQADFDRARELLAKKVISPEEFDHKREALDVAKAGVAQALENVHQARVTLGLPAQPPGTTDLTEVPADLDQTFSSVREALAELIHSAAQLGIVPSSFNLTPKETLAEFYRRDPGGDIDKIYASVMESAPSLKQAEAAVGQADRDLDQAKLDLRYCTVAAEIDGVVTRRNVNPGNNVQVGQSLMAVRSLTDVWVDANFKETQLRDLRIGQKVDLDADMYGSHRKFEGRISGFTMGTGSTLALLPAQNATGNFVKVVQRLPVRIDLVNYDADRAPLFVGLSVTPEVDTRSVLPGPNAGGFLQTAMTNAQPMQP